MQQSKKTRKQSLFWILKLKVKKRKSNDMYSFRDHSIRLCTLVCYCKYFRVI